MSWWAWLIVVVVAWVLVVLSLAVGCSIYDDYKGGKR